jgi:hypothetical protein
LDFSRKARRQSNFYSLASILDIGLIADINLAVNQADGRDAHTPYTQAQSLDGRLVQKNISSAMITIVSHNVKYDENDCKKSKNKKAELER